eukprot:scaffold544802_cov24-Prasinocladus_malaysianus.AAC.1
MQRTFRAVRQGRQIKTKQLLAFYLKQRKTIVRGRYGSAAAGVPIWPLGWCGRSEFRNSNP